MRVLHRVSVSVLGVALATLMFPVVISLAHEGNGSPDVIHACYRQSDGAMIRMQKNAAVLCPTGYKPMHWAIQGPAGLSGYEQLSAFDSELTGFTVPVGETSGPKTFDCPPGKKVLSGGYQINSTNATTGKQIDSNRAVDDDTWLLQVTNTEGTEALFVFPVLVCATAN